MKKNKRVRDYSSKRVDVVLFTSDHEGPFSQCGSWAWCQCKAWEIQVR